MAVDWYYQADGQIHGPINLEQLRQMVQSGRLPPHALVRAGQEGRWLSLPKATDPFDHVTEGVGNPPPDRFPDEWESDEALYNAPPTRGGQILLTTFGVFTLVLASLFAVAGCTSGIGSFFCFTTSSSLLQEGQANSAPSPPGAPAPPPGQSCSALIATMVGGILLVVAFILVALMLGHLLMAGGHFSVGVGVLRRRPWARILALVLSGFTAVYGLIALAEVLWRMFQAPLPADYEIAGQALTALVGLVLITHATLTWVVMFHPACSQQFRVLRDFHADQALV